MATLRYDFVGNNISIKQAASESVASLNAFEKAAESTNAKIAKQKGFIDELKQSIVSLNKQKIDTADEGKLSRINRLLEQQEADLKRLNNIGKSGFNELGNSIEKGKSGIEGFGHSLTGGLGILRQVAYILPGIGVAGIFNAAFEAIGKAAIALDLFNSKLTLSESNLANLNSVNKEASKQYGEQATNLKILYTAATDVTNSENNRLLAAKELQKEFPSLFGNIKTETILNGEAAGAYDLASKAILDNAKAKAAAGKISELAGKQLEEEFTQQKIANARINELKRSRANEANGQFDVEGGGILAGENEKKINERAANAIKRSNQNKKDLQDQIDFLTKFAGGNNKIAQALSAGENTKLPGVTGESPFASLSKELDDLLRKTQSFAAQSGLTGFGLEVQKIEDKYKALNATLDENIRKTTESKKLTNGEKSVLGKQQNIDRAALQSSAAKEFSDALNALYNVKEKAVKDSNEKNIKLEQDLQDKILAINDQAIANIGGKQETETQKIQLEWDKRKKAAQDYYDELLRLNNNSPSDPSDPQGFNKAIKTLQIKSAQSGTNSLINSGSNSEISRKLLEPFTRGIDQGLRKFGNDFYQTITDVDTYTKGSFTSIFADLTGKLTVSLNQVFLNVVVQGLSNALQKAISMPGNGLVNSNGGLTGLGKVAAGATIAGSVISAATPKTSTVGQGLGGALSGAGTGAAIGSIIPGIGTAVGAVVGGAIGLISGIFGSSSARKKQEELQKQQLDEAKKQTDLLRQQNLAYTSQIIGRMTANGVITGIDVGATGQLVATVSGKDLQFVLDRTKKAR